MTAQHDANLADTTSFRDPSGFVFRGEDGCLYRQVNRSYREEFELLNDTGLYGELTKRHLLVEHETAESVKPLTTDAYRIIRPREIHFVSYPYEWSFSALKAAALLTLEVQQRAMKAGLTLKDASGYNVQFEGTRPVFIDTLSFERYEPGMTWKAYAQFCRHFLAPLALMSCVDVSLNRLLSLHIDGIPLELASKLLPSLTRLRLGLLIHIHLLAKMVRWYGDTSPERSGKAGAKGPKRRTGSPSGIAALVEQLRRTVARLGCKHKSSEWAAYYESSSYTSQAFDQKRQYVAELLREIRPQTAWDLGANTGIFSRIATDAGAMTCAFDADHACVDKTFQDCRKRNDERLLPLVLDLTNPSPGLGWAHSERQSLVDRGPVDVVMALALVHHLAISNNVPLANVAAFFHRLCRYLIIEFVPKSDPQTQRLLRSREDIFDTYNQSHFEAAFAEKFNIMTSGAVGSGGRIVYLMSARPL